MPSDREIERSLERGNRAARQRDSEQRNAKQTRENALERSERREWANKKYGDERRWRE
jgi:hypothetical protein